MINFTNVTKKYGKHTALNDISINIPESGIYCLLGRNGAGKTTFMKSLTGHIPYSSGEISINGVVIKPSKMPVCVSYIESGCVQFNTRISTLINHAANIQPSFDKDFALQMAERFKLDTKKKFKQLSFGMKTMVSAIITLANNARVILLDEPTLGFDAIMRSQFNTLLLESYQTHPRVIIISTHLIDEIAKVIERLIIIENGSIVLESSIDDIDERAYTMSGATSVIMPLLDDLNCIGKTTAGSIMAAHIFDERITPPDGIAIDNMGLQDFFINLVGGSDNV